MNSRIFAAFLVSMLMVTGLKAQEISTSPVEGQDLDGGLVAPERAAMVLHVPVNLQALSSGVSTFRVMCKLFVKDRYDEMLSVTHGRVLTLTDGAYQGVLSFSWELSEFTFVENPLPEDFRSYVCTLYLCYDSFVTDTGNTSQTCTQPLGGQSPRAAELSADTNAPFQSRVESSLQN